MDKLGEPNWQLLDIPGIEHFPSLQWKLLNVKKIEKSKWLNLLMILKKCWNCKNVTTKLLVYDNSKNRKERLRNLKGRLFCNIFAKWHRKCHNCCVIGIIDAIFTK